MRLSWNEIRVRAARFAEDWKNAHYEKGETQTFYNEFFEIFGVMRRKVATFEEPVKRLGSKAPGFIDLFWKGTLLVEQKSAGRDLTKAKEQALDYFPGLKDADLPRYVLVCDFQTFELYDLDTRTEVKFRLQDLPKHVQAFSFIFGGAPRVFKDQDPVNIEASELMGKIHDALLASGYEGHELERFLVRLVFCLFADDTGIFTPKGIFEDFIRDRTREDGSDLGPLLGQLFEEVLNRPENRRQKNLDDDLKQFPYVNGDLFAERLGMPAFDSKTRKHLIEACEFDWSAISPAIFGALFQSVMDKKKRRAIGAHYTTEQNILKLIHPLFLDELRTELDRLKARRDTGQTNALRAFQDKLASIRCFDPACGCGNFLVISYRELRALETEVLLALNENRSLDVSALSKVDVDQFFGIELEEFPARIAEIALWMMDHIMNMRLSEALGGYFPRIPLKASPTIRATDALETEWETVLDPVKCTYILGNPPFVGAKLQSEQQRSQITRIAALGSKKGTLDYVSAWFIKAAEYIQNSPAKIAFVATNSITQGEQVAELWPILFQRYSLEISFAHRTFAWGSEARGKAHVHVVIVGLCKRLDEPDTKRLFDYEDINGNPIETRVRKISPYLCDAALLHDPHLVVRETNKPLCPVPSIAFGSMPNDDGNLILTEEDRAEIISQEPRARGWIRPLIGARDYINGQKRYCLWLVDMSPAQFRANKAVSERIQKCRDYRAESKRETTRELAATPYLFGEIRHTGEPYIIVPRHSSEKREYVPMGFFAGQEVAHDSCLFIPGTDLYHFAILNSAMHVSWLRNVGGRIKSDFRYSIGVVYNTFPWPLMTETQETDLRKRAQAILDARAKFPDATLADLYDPTTMPAPLRKAHQVLDTAVDRLYRREPFRTDRERIEFLLARYEELRAPLIPPKKPQRRSRIRQAA